MRRIGCITALVMLLTSPTAATTLVNFDDPLGDQQWYLDAMNFSPAWGQIYNLNKRGVVRAAVLDAGFDLTHRELKNNTFPGYNMVTRSFGVHPANPHGTATIGLLAARSGNGQGITSAAFTANVMPIQITNRSDGAAYTSHMIQGIKRAADKGVRVINLSYTGANQRLVSQAAHYAAKRGAVVFMSAGNDGKLHEDWTNFNWIVAVGSVNKDKNVSSFSSRGAFVDFVAPGESILTTLPGDNYGRWSGTSFSSPLAASVASLMFTVNPKLTAGQAIRILRQTATDLGPEGIDEDSGYGLIDADAAVSLALATKGKWTQRRARRQIKWIDNDLSNISGLVATNSLLSPIAPIADDAFYSPSTIPEPSTGAVVLLTLAALSRRRSRV